MEVVVMVVVEKSEDAVQTPDQVAVDLKSDTSNPGGNGASGIVLIAYPT